MSKQLFDEKGNPISLPTSKEMAKRFRRPHYLTEKDCSECKKRGYEGILTRKRYTFNGACVHCSMLAAIELHALVTTVVIDGQVNYGGELNLINGRFEYLLPGQELGEGRPISDEYASQLSEAEDLQPGPWPTSREGAREIGAKYYIRDVPCARAGHLGVMTLEGDCYYCKKERDTVSPRQRAIANGEQWYLPESACLRCGRRAEKRVDNGQCRGCNPLKQTTPRQEALARGDKWYMPDQDCPRCGTRSEKRVDNGQCKQCASWHRLYADLVISREDAERYGLPVYRINGGDPLCSVKTGRAI